MFKKYMAFGFGIGLCLVLAAALLYGVFTAQQEENEDDFSRTLQAEKNFVPATRAQARFVNTLGEEIGTAQLEESTNGVLIRLEVEGLPAGIHAIHIHEKGACTPVAAGDDAYPEEYFIDAGAHLNPAGAAHGLMHEDGPHAGDLPNIYVAEDGTVKTHLFTDRITLQAENGRGLAHVLDADGAALMIHSGQDDYKSADTGNARGRIACASIIAE